MNKGIIKAIIWKETICFIRNSLLIVLFYIFLLLGTNLFLPSLYIENGIVSPWMNDLLINNSIILSATLTVTVGCVIISQSMGLERREGILKILIGIGIPADIIWVSQYIFAFACGYILWLVSLGLYCLGLPMLYGISLELTGKVLLLAGVVFPVLAALILAVYAWLFWTAKNQTSQVLYSMIPAAVYLISFYLNQAFAEKALEIHIFAVIGLVLICGTGIFIIMQVIKKMNPERLFDS